MTWYPGNPKPCQFNNTQWRTPGWWKLRGSFDKIAPVSLWTASVEIMMALVRGIQEVQKGFCDFESEWQHGELSPVSSSGLGCCACYLFVASYCGVYDFIASNGSELPALARGSCAQADGSEVNRACSVLNLSNNVSYHQPWESCCVWWQSDCTAGHGSLVSASPPGVPQSLSLVCVPLNTDSSPAGFAACAWGQSMISWNEESKGSIPQYKSGTCAEGTEMIQKTEIWRSRRKHESNVQQKRWGNYRSNSVGKQNM